MIDWRVALITLAIVFLFYFIVLYRKPGLSTKILWLTALNNCVGFRLFPFLDVNWGTSSQAMNLQDALNSIQQLAHIEEHVKNYQYDTNYLYILKKMI
jgi:solute carrier family 12 sodium/potassium/chloride transporter 2